MEQFLSKIFSYIMLDYAVAIILLSFIVLYYFISNPSKRMKFFISFFSGLVLGLIWFLFIETDLAKLIVTFLFASGLYKWIKEPLFNILKINYNDK